MEGNQIKSAASAAFVAGPRAALFRSNQVGLGSDDADRIVQNSGAGVGWGFTIGGIASGHAKSVAGAAVGNPADSEYYEELSTNQKTKTKRK